MNRKLFFYKNYFNAFFEKQEDEVKQKIDWTLALISELEHIPQKFLNIKKVQMDCMRLEFRLE